MKFLVQGHGDVEIAGITPVAIAALRLVQYHAPGLMVNCQEDGATLSVRLADIDLRPSFTPPEPTNVDRAQLASLGKQTTGNAQATSSSEHRKA
jgi:hypothetical protein